MPLVGIDRLLVAFKRHLGGHFSAQWSPLVRPRSRCKNRKNPQTGGFWWQLVGSGGFWCVRAAAQPPVRGDTGAVVSGFAHRPPSLHPKLRVSEPSVQFRGETGAAVELW